MQTAKILAVPMLLAFAGADLALAQNSNTGSGPDCDEGWFGRNRSDSNICEIREYNLTATDSLAIDGGPNGGVTVVGWDRDDIRVQVQLIAMARDEERAQEMIDDITIQTSGTIHVDGPTGRNGWWPGGRRNESWLANFYVSAPYDTDLRIESVNGRLSVSDISGDVDVEGTNGSIALHNVSAGVRGRTTNGSINVEYTGTTINGDSVDLRTTNGSVNVSLPEDFSARLEVETVNGGIDVDFPVTVQGRIGREIEATLGQGGPLLRVRTTNGRVNLRRD